MSDGLSEALGKVQVEQAITVTRQQILIAMTEAVKQRLAEKKWQALPSVESLVLDTLTPFLERLGFK